MFKSKSREAPASKCYVSSGTFPRYIDPKQLPSRKKPFSTILNQYFTQTVDVILPEELYPLIWENVAERIENIQYHQVIMSLSELLEPDFLNKYVKTGDVLMLSEGRPGLDNSYYLKDGILRLNLSKENYERCGLDGKPTHDGGRKHVKARYTIEINLRLPSMIHGKRGFERIVWSFKNVLHSTVTWLIYDSRDENGKNDTQISEDLILQKHPVLKVCSPRTTNIKDVVIPALHVGDTGDSDLDFEDWATEIHEWISMLALESPRILGIDQIDPYLCRYTIPRNESRVMSGIIKIQWRGLLPAKWVRKLFIQLCNLSTKNLNFRDNSWVCLSGYSFPTEAVAQQDGYTILQIFGQKMNHDGTLIYPKPQNQSSDEELKQDFILWELSQTCCGEF